MRGIPFGAPPRRALLFASGNLAACGILAATIVVPIVSFFADRDARIEQQSKNLARLMAVVAQSAAIESTVVDAKAQMQGDEFLTGPNENVIGADLQTRLKTIAESVGARTRAAQALPGKTVDAIRYTGSRIELSGSLRSVARIVYAVESSKPYLFVTGATLRLQPPARPGVPEEPVIQAQLDIFGAIRGDSLP